MAYAAKKKAAARITDERERSRAYKEIAISQAEANYYHSAKKTALFITDEGYKEQAYQGIVEATIKHSHYNRANDTAALITNERLRARAYETIFEAQVAGKGEIVFWTDTARYMSLDLQGLFETLKGKQPYKVAQALADAAEDIAKELKELQKNEALWQKKRAKAAK